MLFGQRERERERSLSNLIFVRLSLKNPASGRGSFLFSHESSVPLPAGVGPDMMIVSQKNSSAYGLLCERKSDCPMKREKTTSPDSFAIFRAELSVTVSSAILQTSDKY